MSKHFPRVTEEEYQELRRMGIVGNIHEIFPIPYTVPLKRAKIYKGTLKDKLNSLLWWNSYLKTLIPKIMSL